MLVDAAVSTRATLAQLLILCLVVFSLFKVNAYIIFCVNSSAYITMESKQPPSELDEVKKKIKEVEDKLDAAEAGLRSKNKDITEDEIANSMYLCCVLWLSTRIMFR